MSNLVIDFTEEAWGFLWEYIDAVNTEIGGIGYIEKDGPFLTWHKTVLVPQEVTSGSIDFTDTAFMVEQAHRDGVLGDPDFIWGWWHSHASMGVFWSSTDTDEYIAPFRDAGAPALVSIVGNHDHKYKMRADIFKVPLLGHVTEEEVTARPMRAGHIMQEAEANIRTFVKEKPKDKKQYWHKTTGTWEDEPEGKRDSREDEQAWQADLDSERVQGSLRDVGFVRDDWEDHWAESMGVTREDWDAMWDHIDKEAQPQLPPGEALADEAAADEAAAAAGAAG